MDSVVKLIALKELNSKFKEQKGLINLMIFTIVLSVFSLLFISSAELSLLDEAQVIYMITGTITAIASIVTIIIGADSFAGEKERGTLVPLLVSPVDRNELVAGKSLGILLVWIVLYLISIPYIWALGSTGQNMPEAIFCLGVFGTPVVFGFSLLSMSISAKTGSVLSSLLSTLVIFILSASPLLLSPGLRNSTIGKAIDFINPFACAINSYDSMIIDSEPFSAQLIRFIVVLIFPVIMFLISKKNVKNLSF